MDPGYFPKDLSYMLRSLTWYINYACTVYTNIIQYVLHACQEQELLSKEKVILYCDSWDHGASPAGNR